ncbi:MAG: hypothetical protein ACRD0N_12010 [Acidimicrobiales bacterium]
MPVRSTVALALVLLAGVAASCRGGDGSDATSDQRDTVASSTAATTTAAPAPAPAPLTLGLRGVGPVQVGMTVAEAGAALGATLRDLGAPTEACTLYGPERGFDGLSFLVASGVVARADVTAGTTTTAEGVAIGHTEAEAQRRYGNRLRVTPHDFSIGGHYLTLVPTERADAGYRLVLETDGVRVTSMRAGRLPEVEYTEGCS